MNRPHWTPYKNGAYHEWVFHIDYLVGSVQELEPSGSRYTEKDCDPTRPKVYLAKIGDFAIPTVPGGSDVHHPTAEAAAEAVEFMAIATAHEILNELEPA